MEGDNGGKSGTVTSSVENGIGKIILSGTLQYYDVDFMGIYNVYTDGGTVTASTTQHTYKDNDGKSYTDTDGTIVVSGANSAYIVVTLGTDYELSSELFTASDSKKPTETTTIEDTKIKVEGYMNAVKAKIAGKSFNDAYNTLKNAHLEDYQELFGRVTLDLGCNPEDFERTTDDLLNRYNSGIYSTYLETLFFQYGRYLLIASSRSGALPANLQGAWNTYNIAPWASGYWHNINVQMNYWPAFSTNLAETFESYVEFNEAYMAQAKKYADSIIQQNNSSAYEGAGNNGWTIGVGNTAYSISSDRSPGNSGFTTQLYWDYYLYTQDKTILEEVVLPVLIEAATFITKCVELTEEGYYLVSRSDSPEMFVNGVWYYTIGTTYAQSFAYLNNYNTLLAAKELGILKDNEIVKDKEKYAILNTVLEQIDKYDPINVGLSGQIKEFREEDYYGSVGDEPYHRHISQLVALSPGNIINDSTPAWIDAALVSLAGRSGATNDVGWSYSHKVNLYARAGEGELARQMIAGLFANATTENLWTQLATIFQIEANFGATAGIAEMLMQSNSGYINILPAIPEGWSAGTFTGLVAAGNFEVSAAWSDGVANTVNIKSNKGGSVSVKYPSITGASVINASNGKKVSYTVTGTDIITFDTEEGETYIISGFKKVVRPDAPYKLSYSRAGFGEFNLAATAVENAVKYNLYTAVENASDYTLVATSVTPYFVYTASEENKNARTTFAVTAVGADGVESKRTLCYYNPAYTDADINELYVSFLASGELQVIVDANNNAAAYRLWEKAENGEYTLIDESAFPIVTTKNYNSDNQYAISVISGFDGKESALKPIDSGYKPANVLLGKEFVPTEETKNNVYIYGGEPLGFNLLTDGKHTDEVVGRFSSSKNGKVDATLNLGATYILSELKFKLYRGDPSVSIGDADKFKVEISSGGKWITVFDGATDNINDYKLGSTPYVVFNLGCVQAEKIRFTAEASNNKTVTFHEIECSGILAKTYKNEIQNVLAGTTFVPSEETKNNVYNANMAFDRLTDGDKTSETAGRFSSGYGKDVEATVTINGKYALSELRVYLYKGETVRAGKSFKLEIYRDGEWITVFSGGQNEIKKHLTDRYLSFDLGYAVAEKIRFSASSYDSSNTVTFYEIECSGYAVEEKTVPGMKDNILTGTTFKPTDATKNNVYNYSDTTMSNYKMGYELLTDGERSKEIVGRFSSSKGATVEATAELGSAYALSEIRFYLFRGEIARAGSAFKLEIAYNGIWTTVFEGGQTELSQYLTNGYLSFKTENAIADQIRFSATATGSNDTVTFYEIEASGFMVEEYKLGALENNIFAGKSFVPTAEAKAQEYNSSYGYTKLTDTSAGGRFSTKKSTGFVDATIDLGVAYSLNDLRIRYYIEGSNTTSFVGSAMLIQVYRNGTWYDVVDCKSSTEILSNRNTSLSDFWLSFDLNGVIAEKVRIYVPSTQGSNYSISYYEIECSAKKVDETLPVVYGENVLSDKNANVPIEATASNNVLAGKVFVPTAEALNQIYNSGYGYANLTDGTSARYSSKSKTGIFDATLDLGGIFELDTLKIQYYTELQNNKGEFDFLGTAMTIEVCKNGAWETVISCATNAEIASYKTSDYWISFDLNGVKAEQIRIYIPSCVNAGSGRSIAFYEIECSGTELKGGAISDENSVENAIDGNLDTYLEVLDTNTYSIEIELDRPRALTTLNIYELIESSNLVNGKLSTASDATDIEIYVDGNWTRIYDNLSLGNGITSVDMYNIECSKIRIIFENTRLFDGEATLRAAKIREITCTAADEALDYTEMKDALDKLPTADVEDDVNAKYLNNENYNRFKQYVLDLDATQADIDAYTLEIEAYYATITSATLSAYNISFGGDIAMNFRYRVIDPDTLLLYHDAYVEFIVPSTSGNKTTIVYLKDAKLDSQGRYVFTVYLAAAQMTDIVSLRMVYDENTFGKTYQFTVREYADYIFENEDIEKAYPGITDLLYAMLNYGGYAQEYFGYNTENLANARLYADGKNPVLTDNISDNSAICTTGDASGISFSGWKIALLSKTTARIYFTLNGGGISDYTFKLTTPNGAVKELNAVKDGERYRVDVRDIGAGNLDNVYTVTVTNKNDSTTASIEFSATCYVSSVLSSSADANLINLVKALKLYSDAANAYINKTPIDKGIINVWLIGGQSNAVGFGMGSIGGASTDSRYTDGFENTLYYAFNQELDNCPEDFVNVKLGLGRTEEHSGAELGIAKALADDGSMNAVIKCAWGGTFLYPAVNTTPSKRSGTWTSPSYVTIANSNDSIPNVNYNDKITSEEAGCYGKNVVGTMYNMLIETVTEGVVRLKEMGYTPVLRGMWWMQGEAESYYAEQAQYYELLLECLINDIRADMSEIFGEDQGKNMPFVCGNIIWNGSNAPEYVDTINEAQDAVSSRLQNVYVLKASDTKAQSFFAQHDTWHFNAATQEYFGKRFVDFVLNGN